MSSFSLSFKQARIRGLESERELDLALDKERVRKRAWLSFGHIERERLTSR